MSSGPPEALGPIRGAVAAIGAAFIELLLRIFGRTLRREDVPWLAGPIGGDYIGDKPYEECAAREGLTLTRNAESGGLIPNFDLHGGDGFDVGRVPAAVRHFYEQTTSYRMDVWAESRFPASIALWLLVTTISRKVNQLNFPLRVLDAAKGMDSEIVLLRDPTGKVRYAGWYRSLRETKRVIYTGFYMTERVPLCSRACVKVVFPMPNGNATVILKPGLDADGNFELSSRGTAFGDTGFYRLAEKPGGRVLVWRIRSLHEHFRLYVDSTGTLRCDHSVRFLGFPVLHLHYRIEKRRADGRDVA